MAAEEALTGAGDDVSTLPRTTSGTRAADAPWIPGGRYVRGPELGRGASKRVYSAYDTLLDREVAVAIVAGATAVRTRLLREVRTAGRLGEHAHIVSVHDVGEADGTAWVVSQLVRGGSVADHLARTSAGLAVGEAARIGADVADALAFAHEGGVVHRDVKPSNVLLDDAGTALLADFGVALLADEARLTADGVPIGTACYMPPEQARGEAATGRSDLYALGAMLFELVCGTPPFTGDTVTVIAQQLNRPPADPRTLNADVPDVLAALILQLLEKEPGERPGDARAVCAALRALTVDGPAEAVARSAARPLPPSLRADPGRPFVGRDAALALLRRAWRHSGDGRAGFTLLSGEAGIGKTRLATAFAEEAAREGALVLHGRCDDDAPVSYQPFVEALRDLIVRQPDVTDALDAVWTTELVELARLVPELRARVPVTPGRDPDEPAQRYLLFEAVAAMFVHASSDRPVLLVVDDLHWADEPTARLLRHLLRTPLRGMMMVVGTLRTEDLEGAESVVATMGELARVPAGDPERLAGVALGGLDESEIRDFVRARERNLDPEFVSAINARTGGNPFFIEEVLRGLDDLGLATPEGAVAALASVGVPDDVAVVIRTRLRRLSPETVDLLTLASASGREFRLDLLAEVVGAERHAVAARVEEGIAAGLVLERAIGRYAFCHALVRETLALGVMSKTGRAQQHLRLGEALVRLDGERVNDAEAAVHFHAAREVGGAERAVAHALAAADAAAQALAYEDAAEFMRRAIEALEVLGPSRDAQRCQVLDTVGRLEWRAGDKARAQGTFLRVAELARGLGDVRALARAALGYAGRSYEAETIDPTLDGLLQEALDRTPSEEEALRARLMARLAEARHPIDVDAAAEISAEAVVLARRAGDPTVLVATLAGRHMALLHARHLEERMAVGAEWLALAERAGRDHAAPALHWNAYDLLEAGDIEGVRDRLERLERLSQHLRQPLYRHFALSWRAKLAHMAGRFDEAEMLAAETLRYGRRAQGGHVALLYAGLLYGVRRSQGRLASLEAEAARLVGADPTLPIWRAGIVTARCAAGDARGARALLEELAEDDLRRIPRDMFWLSAVCLLAEAAVLLGATEHAARIAPLLARYGDHHAQVGLAFYLGPVRGFRAALAALDGDDAAAAADLRAACAAAEAVGAVTECARLRAALDALPIAARDGR